MRPRGKNAGGALPSSRAVDCCIQGLWLSEGAAAGTPDVEGMVGALGLQLQPPSAHRVQVGAVMVAAACRRASATSTVSHLCLRPKGSSGDERLLLFFVCAPP